MDRRRLYRRRHGGPHRHGPPNEPLSRSPARLGHDRRAVPAAGGGKSVGGRCCG